MIPRRVVFTNRLIGSAHVQENKVSSCWLEGLICGMTSLISRYRIASGYKLKCCWNQFRRDTKPQHWPISCSGLLICDAS